MCIRDRIIKCVRGQPLMDTVCECVTVQIDQSIGIHGKFLLKIYFEFIVMEPFRRLDVYKRQMENLWLAADEIGLGGVWLGVAPREERMKDVEKIVGIPAGQRAFGIFALGYPDEERTRCV